MGDGGEGDEVRFMTSVQSETLRRDALRLSGRDNTAAARGARGHTRGRDLFRFREHTIPKLNARLASRFFGTPFFL